MSVLARKEEKLRKNFYLSIDLLARAERVAKEKESNLSLVVSEALRHYLENLERQEIELALEEGYKANYELDKQMNEEWKTVDAE